MKSHLNSGRFYQGLLEAMESDLGPLMRNSQLDLSTVRAASVSLLGLSLLKKLRVTTQKDILETKASLAFQTAEQACALTNSRLLKSYDVAFTPRVDAVISIARRKIGDLLGDFGYVEAFARCNHGPGVTRSINDCALGLDTKYDEIKLSVSRTALPFARIATSGVLWPMARHIIVDGPASLVNNEFCIHECDKIAFVPKNATSFRSIAIGPTLNVYMQLGVGRALTKRLLRWRLDLSNQSLNSDLAKWGSYSDSLATVDLKAASDHISRGLVRQLLPDHVYDLLDKLRSKEYDLNGSRYTYQKFSGMGNGFTFPLQTMIFHSLASACCRVLGLSDAFTATYGDDIVVPVQACDLLFEVLAECGLVVNLDKTFTAGPFYKGHDIRPVYWKGFNGSPTSQEICKLMHLLKLWRDRAAEAFLLDATVRFLRKCIHILEGDRPDVPHVPINAPVGAGWPDDYCHLDTWVGRAWSFIPDSRRGRDASLYAASLDGGLTATGNRVSRRGRGTWKIRRLHLCLGHYS